MKILFYSWPLYEIGGGQKMMCKAIDHLSKRHEIDVLTLFPVKREKLENYYSVDLSRVKFRHLFESSKIHPTLLKIMISNKVSKMSRNYDLFFNADAQETVKPLAKYNLLYCQFPDPLWYRPFKGFSDMLKMSLLVLLRKFFGNHSKDYSVYCNSNYGKKWLKKLWDVEAKVINPPIEIPSKTYSKKNNWIISTGRITPDKNYDFVIDIFKEAYKNNKSLADYKLLICGKSFDVDYLTRLRTLAKGYPIEFRLDLPNKKMIEVYSKSKIFIQAKGLSVNEEKYPALLEHFGMTPLEAMSYGCVPLVLNKGGYMETVETTTGFKFNNRQEALNYLITLINDEKLRNKMASAGIKKVKKFSLNVMNKKFDEALRAFTNS
jgi:glycosyltransferase involved in cell wall biosynthesis